MTDQSEIVKIQDLGNLPENWLEYLSSLKKSCSNKENFQRLLCLYERATQQIPKELQIENLHFAKLLLDYAKLQSKVSPDRARTTFKAARNCCETLAIVYIASAEFELRQGNQLKCRQVLRRGRELNAQPLNILTEAYKNVLENRHHLIDEVTEEQTFFDIVQQENMKSQNSRKNSDNTDSSVGSGFSDSGEHGSVATDAVKLLSPILSELQLPPPPAMSSIGPILPSHERDSPVDIITFKPPRGIKPKTENTRSHSHSSSSGDDISDTVPFLAPMISGGCSTDALLHRGCMSAQKLKSTPAGKKEMPSLSTSNVNSFSARKPRTRKAIGPPLRVPPSVKEHHTAKGKEDVFFVDKENIYQESKSSKCQEFQRADSAKDNIADGYIMDGIKPLTSEPTTETIKPQKDIVDGSMAALGSHQVHRHRVLAQNQIENVPQNETSASQNGLVPQKGTLVSQNGMMSQDGMLPQNGMMSQGGMLPQNGIMSQDGVLSQNMNEMFLQNGMFAMREGQMYPSIAPPQANSVPCDVIVVNGKRYLKLGILGKGGSSKVFQCQCIDSGKIVAVKNVNLEDADDMIIQCYLNEITLLKRLQGKEYIIKLFDWEITPSRSALNLVMECGDVDLNTYIRKNREQMTIAILIYCWEQMLNAVSTIHEEGIVHCDLKPANFLVVEGTWKLIDFGISSAIQGDSTSILRESHIGTLNYMSPEAFLDISQQLGRNQPQMKIGRPSDVWSLGCILYLMVYGKTPFQHIRNNIIKRQAIIDPAHVIEFPENKYKNRRLQETMKWCLCRDPRQRKTIDYLLSHSFVSNKVDENRIFDYMQTASPRTALIVRGMMQQLTSAGAGSSPPF